MHRPIQWLMAVVALLSPMTLVRAADPVPMAMPELNGLCCEQEAAPCRGGLIGGVGFYWVQPYFENNPAFSVSVTSPTGPGGTETRTTDRTDIRHHMTVAPQLWLGYLGESGLGGRVRWWYLRQGTDQSVSVPAGDGEAFIASSTPLGFMAFADNEDRPASMSVTSKLQLQVWDLEVVQSTQVGRWDLLFAGGLRWVELNQEYNAYVVGDSGDGAGPITGSVLSGHSFHGIGPELALEARRRLGDGGLTIYSSARGAVLFGSANQSVADVFRTPGGVTLIETGREHRNRLMPVGELELGVEFASEAGSSRVFGQVGVVGQQWWSAGSASRGVQTNTFGVDDTAQGSIVDSDLGFVGLVVRLGVNY